MYLKKQIFCISFILWKWFYLTFKVFFYSAAEESLLLGFSQDEISLYSLAVLKLTLQTRMTLNPEIPCSAS